jgi:hypothetical protein
MLLTVSTWVWRLILGVIFVTAAWTKWRAGVSYMPPETIYERLVAMSSFRHYLFVAIEGAIGLWLLSGMKMRWSSVAAAVMLLAFAGVLAAELLRRNPLDCGCGIREITPDGDPRVAIYMSLARNGVLLFGCWWLWILADDGKPDASDAEAPQPIDPKQ